MKVLVIPDSHLKLWVIEHGIELADRYRVDKIVTLGDYFDDWISIDRDYYDMMDYLKVLLRREHRLIALFGNHELSYFGYPCSGHKRKLQPYIYDKLANDQRLFPAVGLDGVLYSHAGVCLDWIRENKILTENAIRYGLTRAAGASKLEDAICRQEFNIFAQAGALRGGHGAPSCVWADARELIADHIPKVSQIVGHTPVKEITFMSNCWFTDVFSNGNVCDEYLLVEDGEPKIVHYNEVTL